MTPGTPVVVLDEWLRPPVYDILGNVIPPDLVTQYAYAYLSPAGGRMVTLNDVRASLGLLPDPGRNLLFAWYLVDRDRRGYVV